MAVMLFGIVKFFIWTGCPGQSMSIVTKLWVLESVPVPWVTP